MSLHIVTLHDGWRWLDDHLVSGDFGPKVTELLMGEPKASRVLIDGVSQAFYRDVRSVLVITFKPGVERQEARRTMEQIRSGREDTN